MDDEATRPHFADAAGTRIAYDSDGDGPDLLFLHAAIADRTMWAPQVEQFSDRFRVTAPDMRCFGESALGSEPFSRRDDWAAVLGAIGADSATVIGCSMGGSFALDFAVERPELVDKLVLVGTTPRGWEGDDDPFLTEMDEKVEAAIENRDYEDAGRMEARLWVDGKRPDGTSPQWLRDKVVEWSIPINKTTNWGSELSKQLEPTAFERLGDLRVPTLIIVGDADFDVIMEGSKVMGDAIPDAELIVLEGTAHLPNLEVTDAFNAALEAFLA